MKQGIFWASTRYLFNKRNDLQAKNAKDLIALITMPEDAEFSMLDIGCGTGNITASLTSKYPNATVTGLDASPSMLAAARSHYPNNQHPKLTFVEGDITDYQSTEKFDVIVSFNCFHWVPNLNHVFKSIHLNLLKPDGTLCFMLYPRVAALWNAIDDTARENKWRSYFPDYHSPYQKYQRQDIEAMLSTSGFTDLKIQETNKTTKYDSGINGLKEYIWGFLPILDALPNKALQSAFLDDIMAKYITYVPLNSDGSLDLHFSQINALAKRCVLDETKGLQQEAPKIIETPPSLMK